MGRPRGGSLTPMLAAAVAEADARARREGRDYIVYFVQSDRYGRDLVWFVRTEDEDEPSGDNVRVMYRARVRGTE